MKKINMLACVGILLFLTLQRASLPLLFADTQSVTVSGIVVPRNSDFQVGITSDATGILHGDSIVTYTITYGSRLYYAGPVTIQTQWDRGTIQGGTATSTVDGLNYIVGSAGITSGASPVIDLVNQKITWTIPSFPAQTTNQSVTFKLAVSSSYSGTSAVNFPVRVRLITSQVTTPDQSSTLTYQLNPPAATPTPIPTPTIVPTPSVPPPRQPANLFFTNLSFRSIIDSSIRLLSQTSVPAQLTVSYGTSPTQLIQRMYKSPFTSVQDILLDNLTANTTYYIQMTATDASGNTKTSEVFNFTTALPSEKPVVNKDSVSFISSDIVLFVPRPQNTDTTSKNQELPKPLLVVPQDLSYNFRFQVTKGTTVTKVQTIVRNAYVLGITSNQTEEPNTQITDLIETQPGVYEGRLKTPSLPGSYEEFARIYDEKGNIVEDKIADITVSQPLRVYRKDTKQPIERAQMYISYFNFRTKAYLPLPPQLFPVKNPSYTDLNGQDVLALPQGKYQVHITAVGYKEKDVFFTLGPNPGENYPAVFLTAEPFNIVTTVKYYINILSDFLGATKTYVQDISYSVRFFDLNAVVSVSILVFLTLLSFSSRIHVPLRWLFSYFLHYARILSVQKKLGTIIKGRVFEKDSGTPINLAEVYLVAQDSETIFAHTHTDIRGDFLFKILPEKGYDIQVMAEGYEPTRFHQSEIHAVELGGYLLGITKTIHAPSLQKRVMIFITKFFALWFEALLLLSVLFELSLGYTLGWNKALIFFVISLVNLSLWILHLSHLRSEKNIF